MSATGVPGKYAFASVFTSPNERINEDEATRLAETEAAAAALTLGPARRSSVATLPCQFFLATSAPEEPQTASPPGRASRHGGAALDVASIYQGNDAGGMRHIHTLSPGISVAGLFYISYMQQVVCLGNDNSLVTLAEDGDAWQVTHAHLHYLNTVLLQVAVERVEVCACCACQGCWDPVPMAAQTCVAPGHLCSSVVQTAHMFALVTQ